MVIIVILLLLFLAGYVILETISTFQPPLYETTKIHIKLNSHMGANSYYNHLGEPITLLRQSNRKTHPDTYIKEARAAGVRPTGVVEAGNMRAVAVEHVPIQEPTKWVKRRKLVTARNPEGVERGPSRMIALPHNLAKRPDGRRPKRT